MRRNWLERVVLGASVLTIVGLVGYLGFETFQGDPPPVISVEPHPDEARTTPTGWELPFTVHNTGGEPAESVTIEATASVAGTEETSELVLELAAPGTAADLVAGFSGPPDGEVSFRVVGYEAP